MRARSKTTGKMVLGTYECVHGCALVDEVYFDADGKFKDMSWAGETKMYWDGQETVTGPNRERIWIDEDGSEVLESDLEPATFKGPDPFCATCGKHEADHRSELLECPED